MATRGHWSAVSDWPKFETEGDAREFVQANPDKAVRTEASMGSVWFWADDDGNFEVTLDFANTDTDRVAEGPKLGDENRLTPEECHVEDADDVPERTEYRNRVKELIDEYRQTLDLLE